MAENVCGLIVIGLDYAAFSHSISQTDGIYLVQTDCKKADRGAVEKENTAVKLDGNELYLRVKVKQAGAKKPTQKADYKCECTFYTASTVKFLPGKAFNKKMDRSQK